MITTLKFLTLFTILLDTIAIFKVIKDNQYLFDNEKTKLYIIIIAIPIIGAFYALKKVGFGFLNFIYPLSKAMNTKVSRENSDIVESKLDTFEDLLEQ